MAHESWTERYGDSRDLRDNSITTIGNSVPWPTAAMLQTLLLDSNSLDEIKADAFVGLTSLQYLYVDTV